MRVELAPLVSRDLEEIAAWIARDNPRRAISFIQEIREVFKRIGHDPLLYRLRPEIGSGARAAVIGRYLILFRVDEAFVRVERVLHGGRDLPPLVE